MRQLHCCTVLPRLSGKIERALACERGREREREREIVLRLYHRLRLKAWQLGQMEQMGRCGMWHVRYELPDSFYLSPSSSLCRLLSLSLSLHSDSLCLLLLAHFSSWRCIRNLWVLLCDLCNARCPRRGTQRAMRRTVRRADFYAGNVPIDCVLSLTHTHTCVQRHTALTLYREGSRVHKCFLLLPASFYCDGRASCFTYLISQLLSAARPALSLSLAGHRGHARERRTHWYRARGATLMCGTSPFHHCFNTPPHLLSLFLALHYTHFRAPITVSNRKRAINSNQSRHSVAHCGPLSINTHTRSRSRTHTLTHTFTHRLTHTE